MADLARLFNFNSETGLPIHGSEIDSELNQIIARLNDVDADSLIAALATQLGISQAGNPRRGHFEQAASGTRTNVAYGALSNGPDVVAGVVVPANALVKVYYQAVWQESVAGAARAALFVGASQLQVALVSGGGGSAGPVIQAAATNGGAAAKDTPLVAGAGGLFSAKGQATAYTADPTTGMASGLWVDGLNSVFATCELNGATIFSSGGGAAAVGNGVVIDNLAAGTYDFSVQFKATSGTVTAKNRRLRVVIESY